MRILHALLVASPLTRLELRPLLAANRTVHLAAEVADLTAARDVLEMLKVDVVLLETSLPGEDAFELLPYIPITTRVLCLTADSCDLMRALTYGSLECVPLPVRAGALAAGLDNVGRGREIAPLVALRYA